MYNDVLSIIGLLAILTMIIALPVLSANIGPVNALNINPEEVVSQGPVEDKILEQEDSFKELLIITPNAEGSNSEENSEECENESNCFNVNLNDDTENKKLESTLTYFYHFLKRTCYLLKYFHLITRFISLFNSNVSGFNVPLNCAKLGHDCRSRPHSIVVLLVNHSTIK